MDKEFKNKTALITGAASGIGRETALEFARLGCNIVVCDLDEVGGNTTVDLVKKTSADAVFLNVDVTETTDVKKMVSATVEKFDNLDFAVNNAGVLSPEARTGDYSEEDWRRLINVNLTGVFFCMKYELQQMNEQRSGVIVNVASIAGLRGFAKNPAYVASKHGVVGLTKSAAVEYARRGIRINAVCPGYTSTPMADQAIKFRPDLEGQLEKRIPLNRLGKPEEIAQAIVFLCSEKAGFILGHNLVLDGGITAI